MCGSSSLSPLVNFDLHLRLGRLLWFSRWGATLLLQWGTGCSGCSFVRAILVHHERVPDCLVIWWWWGAICLLCLVQLGCRLLLWGRCHPGALLVYRFAADVVIHQFLFTLNRLEGSLCKTVCSIFICRMEGFFRLVSHKGARAGRFSNGVVWYVTSLCFKVWHLGRLPVVSWERWDHTCIHSLGRSGILSERSI